MTALWLLFSTLRRPPPLDHVAHLDQTCSVLSHHFMGPRWFHSVLVSTWTLKASVMRHRPLDGPLSNYRRLGGKFRRCSFWVKDSRQFVMSLSSCSTAGNKASTLRGWGCTLGWSMGEVNRGYLVTFLSITGRKWFHFMLHSIELQHKGWLKPEDETPPGPERQMNSLLRKPAKDLNAFVLKALGLRGVLSRWWLQQTCRVTRKPLTKQKPKLACFVCKWSRPTTNQGLVQRSENN